MNYLQQIADMSHCTHQGTELKKWPLVILFVRQLQVVERKQPHAAETMSHYKYQGALRKPQELLVASSSSS
jgi:hypothetical protein